MSVTTTSAPQQQVNFPAVDLRQLFGSSIAVEGLRGATDLQAAQHGAGNMSVDVSAGSCVIQDDHASGGGFYGYTLAATTNVLITAANPSNPRIDRIVVSVHDAYSGDGDNALGVVAIAGTATAGATLANLNGAAAVPGSSLLLANVLVAAGGTSILTAAIANVASVAAVIAPPPVWIAPTLLNSWTNAGGPYNPAGYFKDILGFVHLRGVIANGVGGAVFFNLPAGYRPAHTYELAGARSTPGADVVQYNVTATGDVYSSDSVGDTRYLDGLTFAAA